MTLGAWWPNPFAPSFTHLLSTGWTGLGRKSGVNCSAGGDPIAWGRGGVSEPRNPSGGQRDSCVRTEGLMVKDEGGAW